MGGLISYALNLAVLRPLMHSDLKEMGLNAKYFSMDLNAEAMKYDLKQKGIEINARFYNLEEAQKAAERIALEERRQQSQKQL